MKRHFVLAAVLAAAACQGSLCLAAGNDLIPETTANRHGLTRPWFAQVDLDASRSRVRDVILDRGVLFVQTDHARIHAIDAETGRTLWSKQVGRANHPSMTPGLSDKLLVSINGSRLYALNRFTGEPLYESEIKGAPGAGAAVSSTRAYVPMVSGMVMAFRLELMTDARKELGIARHDAEDDDASAAETTYENLRLRQDYVSPLSCQSEGRALIQPLILRDTNEEEFSCWPTDLGHLNIGYVDKRMNTESLVIRCRKEGVVVNAKPAFLPGNLERGTAGILFFGARDGFVYAISEKTGDEFWRFSAGDPIVQPVARIDDKIYAATQFGGLFCLEAKPASNAGAEIWHAPKVTQFLAASSQRIYALDHLNRFVILDAANGARVDSLPVGEIGFIIGNNDTDRVYLISKTGLVQCLHEVELAQPLKHNAAATEEQADDAEDPAESQPAKKAGAAGAKKPGKAPAKGPAKEVDPDDADAGDPNPFDAGGGDAGADSGMDAGADAPADDAPADDAGDNPFGN